MINFHIKVYILKVYSLKTGKYSISMMHDKRTKANHDKCFQEYQCLHTLDTNSQMNPSICESEILIGK